MKKFGTESFNFRHNTRVMIVDFQTLPVYRFRDIFIMVWIEMVLQSIMSTVLPREYSLNCIPEIE